VPNSPATYVCYYFLCHQLCIKIKTHVLFSFLNLSIHGAMVVLPVTFGMVNALNLIPLGSIVVDMQYIVKSFSVFLSLYYTTDIYKKTQCTHKGTRFLMFLKVMRRVGSGTFNEQQVCAMPPCDLPPPRLSLQGNIMCLKHFQSDMCQTSSWELIDIFKRNNVLAHVLFWPLNRVLFTLYYGLQCNPIHKF
jgi:hypothetical protein